MSTKKTASKKPTPKQFKAEAKIMGKTFKGKGETIYEALGTIKTGGIHGPVILTVSGENGSKERVLPAVRARRIFTSLGLMREVGLKQASDMFDGV